MHGYDITYLVRCLLKIVPISLLMGGVAYWIDALCRQALSGRLFGNLISLSVAILSGGFVYALLISKAGIREIVPIQRKILSKIINSRA